MEVNEDKISLIKDLCGKIPYKVIIHVKKGDNEYDGELKSVKGEYMLVLYDGIESTVNINEAKPYYRSLSSMSSNELEEINNITNEMNENESKIYKLFDFFNSHYIDLRNFIGKNLALEAPIYLYNIN